MEYYPVNLDLSGRPCLVVGGGSVAARKTGTLLPTGARIRLVSPVALPIIGDYAERGLLEWRQRLFQDADVEGMFMVFAATDDSRVQRRIARLAREAGALLNGADMPEHCDFQVPAQVRRGDLLLTVATGGGSPALAARIKLSLSEAYGPEYGILVALMKKIRGRFVGSESSRDNSLLFNDLLELPLLELIREQRWSEVRDQLAGVLPERVDSEKVVAELVAEIGEGRS